MKYEKRAIVIAAFAAAIALRTEVAFAQDASAAPARDDGTTERARARYEAGLAFAGERRWDEAARAFRESYELLPAAPSLVNLVLALSEAGRCGETRAVARTLEAEHPDLEESVAHRARAAAVACTATLELRGISVRPVTILVDGIEVPDDGARPIVLALDPGVHDLRVTAPERETFAWTGHVDAGGRESVLVVLRDGDRAVRGDDPAREMSHDDAHDSRRRRRIAILGSTALVVVGAAFGLGFGLRPSSGPPSADDVLRPD